MDVERLMQDLSVEQLHSIHSDLSAEMEIKKEELRQMVGRRYRDVLDASSAVRRVTRMADSLAKETHSLRSAASECCVLHEHKHCALLTRVSVMLKLYHLMGMADPLSDAYLLCLVSSMHRTLSADSTSINHKLAAFLANFSPKLITTKLNLEHDLLASLSTIHCPHQLTNQLAALALLQKHSLQDLLDVYLSHKLNDSTDAVSRSLTERVWGMRESVECIEHVFVQDHLHKTLSIVKSNAWIPTVLREALQDESLSFSLQVRNELTTPNQHLSSLQVVSVDAQVVHSKCLHFLHSLCQLFKPSVIHKCQLFETCSSLLDFLNVLLDAFREDWPVIGQSVAVYQQLFGTALIDRFEELVESELSSVEHALLRDFPSTECHPTALFTKRVPKFDAQLASGVSKQLAELVHGFDLSLGRIWEAVTLYERLGNEPAVPQLRARFAVAVVTMLHRLCSSSDVIVHTEEGPQALKALCLARLYLALLQSRTTVISTCLSKNTEHISQCAQLLKSTAEKCFGEYLHQVVWQCAKDSQLYRIATLPQDPFACLSCVQQFERVDLPDVGTVEVPLQINTLLYNFLHSVALKMSEQSLGHLCSRAVRSQVGAAAREQVLAVYEQAAREQESMPSRVTLQYAFDVRVLHLLFPSERARSLITELDSLMDPFDVSLLSKPLACNARIAAYRYAMVLGNMLSDVVTAKECPLSESYLAVVDMVPRVSDLARFSLIPRLSKHMTAQPSSVNVQSRKKATSHLQAEGVRNTPSFSSFSKLATSWFGN